MSTPLLNIGRSGKRNDQPHPTSGRRRRVSSSGGASANESSGTGRSSTSSSKDDTDVRSPRVTTRNKISPSLPVVPALPPILPSGVPTSNEALNSPHRNSHKAALRFLLNQYQQFGKNGSGKMASAIKNCSLILKKLDDALKCSDDLNEESLLNICIAIQKSFTEKEKAELNVLNLNLLMPAGAEQAIQKFDPKNNVRHVLGILNKDQSRAVTENYDPRKILKLILQNLSIDDSDTDFSGSGRPKSHRGSDPGDEESGSTPRRGTPNSSQTKRPRDKSKAFNADGRADSISGSGSTYPRRNSMNAIAPVRLVENAKGIASETGRQTSNRDGGRIPRRKSMHSVLDHSLFENAGTPLRDPVGSQLKNGTYPNPASQNGNRPKKTNAGSIDIGTNASRAEPPQNNFKQIRSVFEGDLTRNGDACEPGSPRALKKLPPQGESWMDRSTSKGVQSSDNYSDIETSRSNSLTRRQKTPLNDVPSGVPRKLARVATDSQNASTNNLGVMGADQKHESSTKQDELLKISEMPQSPVVLSSVAGKAVLQSQQDSASQVLLASTLRDMLDDMESDFKERFGATAYSALEQVIAVLKPRANFSLGDRPGRIGSLIEGIKKVRWADGEKKALIDAALLCRKDASLLREGDDATHIRKLLQHVGDQLITEKKLEGMAK